VDGCGERVAELGRDGDEAVRNKDMYPQISQMTQI
jgi:hypothetical protein